MKPLLVTSGEPAGIGLDVCLALSTQAYPVVIVANKHALAERAQQLGVSRIIQDYDARVPVQVAPDVLTVMSLACDAPVVPGQLDVNNAHYVMRMLTEAVTRCLHGEFAGLVTAPIQKSMLNEAGYAFQGHTEFLASVCGVSRVVMLLVCSQLRVALVTTHLPLRAVPDAITVTDLLTVFRVITGALQRDFGIPHARIAVLGLNPHAGESGYLGREELDVIQPAIALACHEGLRVFGPFAADTVFTSLGRPACDVFLAMYHDQGLPVLKCTGFGEAVNVTLGLPIIRTSVDHGTALALAGTGAADASSLLAAVDLAARLVQQREVSERGHH